MRKKYFFYSSFLHFFRFWAKNFWDFWPKNFNKVSKTTFYVSRGTVCGLKFFSKVLNRFGFFLQKPSAWFSKFYLRVQSKNCGRNSFLIFLFRIFSDFERKLSDFWPKNVKNLSKLPSTCPEGQFVAWFFLKKKNFEPFWLFYRNFWHGSQNSIYVSRVKFAEEITFSFFFSEFFRFLSENFQTFGQKTSKTCENYLLRVHRNNL